MFNTKPLLLLSLCALLGGCATVEKLTEESGSDSLKGKPVEAIRHASAILFQGGRLMVANQGGSAGIAVIDTGTGLIGEFYEQPVDPVTLAMDTATDRLYATNLDKAYNGSMTWVDFGLKRTFKSTRAVGNNAAVYVLGGTLYLADESVTTPQAAVRPMFAAPGMDISVNGYDATFNFSILDVTRAGSHLYVAQYSPGTIWVLDAPYPANGPRNAVDLTSPGDTLAPGNIKVSLLTTWGGYLFAAINHGNYYSSDSSYVAVIDTSTLKVVKTIPLQYRDARHGSVRDGIWYLTVSGPDFGQVNDTIVTRDGGVEAINLMTQSYGGIIATEQDLGGNVTGFVSTAPGTGYAIYSPGPKGDTRLIRKILF